MSVPISDPNPKVPGAPSPAELRSVFCTNLRALVDQGASVSAICRDLSINRTQFNRFLSGESFPRPDVLHRICFLFGVDARILLEPLEHLRREPRGISRHPFLAGFLERSETPISQTDLPSGFYHYAHPSFLFAGRFAKGLIHIRREDGLCFLRSFEPASSHRLLGLSDLPSKREVRGVILPQPEGVMFLYSRRQGASSHFGFMSREPMVESCLWVGHAGRGAPGTGHERQAVRMVFEHLDQDIGRILTAARTSGLCDAGGLAPHHRQLLQVDGGADILVDQGLA